VFTDKQPFIEVGFGSFASFSTRSPDVCLALLSLLEEKSK